MAMWIKLADYVVEVDNGGKVKHHRVRLGNQDGFLEVMAMGDDRIVDDSGRTLSEHTDALLRDMMTRRAMRRMGMMGDDEADRAGADGARHFEAECDKLEG
jgi:hypothetical protein